VLCLGNNALIGLIAIGVKRGLFAVHFRNPDSTGFCGQYSVSPFLGKSLSWHIREVSIQGANPEALDWNARFSSESQFTTAFALTQMDPVGGLVTGTLDACFLDKGFQQDRAITIDLLPMAGKQPGHSCH
jgi:hypothetical protein